MPDTPTPKRGYLRPKLGKKPWKKEWDFNFGKLDSDVGGLIDGTVSAGNALSIQGAALAAFFQETTGTLSGSFSDGTTTIVEIDHSATIIFDIPTEPVFTNISGVTFILVGNRATTGNSDYGGKFRVQVTNNSGSPLDGTTVTWRRKGLKV